MTAMLISKLETCSTLLVLIEDSSTWRMLSLTPGFALGASELMLEALYEEVRL